MLEQLDTLIGLVVIMSVISLLITIITQIISSLFGLRGKNLADALEALAYKIDPDIDRKTKGLALKLANEVLMHSAVSDSSLSVSGSWPDAWKRASAIRPDEMLDVLKQLAGATTVPANGPTTVAEAAATLLQKLNTPSASTAAALAAINAQLPALAAAKGAAIVQELNAATNVALQNVEGWFNAVQDRAKQWFAMHMRLITVFASVAAAFALHLDLFTLLKRISTDADLRSRLVATAPVLQQQAKEVFDAANPANPAHQTRIIAELNKQFPGITNHLVVGTNAMPESETARWLTNQLAASAFSNRTADIAARYMALAEEQARKQVSEWSHQFGVVSEEFSKTGIDLWPSREHSFGACLTASHFLGMAASAALLSLGAPFWFNILKSLTNLRPLLAKQIDKNPKATAPE